MNNRYIVTLAKTKDEVREAQALRYHVFVEELGAKPYPTQLIDEDSYDNYCKHLLVRDIETNKVVGCYRIIEPKVAAVRGAFFSETYFDLHNLKNILPKTVEVGRACIHPDFRSGSVIMLLWSGLAKFILENNYEYLIGCASIPLTESSENIAAIYSHLYVNHLALNSQLVYPKNPYPVTVDLTLQPVRLPPLIKGYTRLGALLCGEPGVDPNFNTVDLFILLPIKRIPKNYAKHFLGLN